jgi:hypothetical protein
LEAGDEKRHRERFEERASDFPALSRPRQAEQIARGSTTTRVDDAQSRARGCFAGGRSWSQAAAGPTPASHALLSAKDREDLLRQYQAQYLEQEAVRARLERDLLASMSVAAEREPSRRPRSSAAFFGPPGPRRRVVESGNVDPERPFASSHAQTRYAVDAANADAADADAAGAALRRTARGSPPRPEHDAGASGAENVAPQGSPARRRRIELGLQQARRHLTKHTSARDPAALEAVNASAREDLGDALSVQDLNAEWNKA